MTQSIIGTKSMVVSPHYLASVAGEIKYGKDFRENRSFILYIVSATPLSTSSQNIVPKKKPVSEVTGFQQLNKPKSNSTFDFSNFIVLFNYRMYILPLL